VKYAFMLAHVADFSVSGMCRVFEISRSGFYDWQASREQRQQRLAKQAALDGIVKKAFYSFKMRYGARRLYHELKAQGYSQFKKARACR
jgi:putative transposase